MSIARQGEQLGLARSIYYYEPQAESRELAADAQARRVVFEAAVFRQPQMAVELGANRKRLQRLMGIEAHYPKPNLSRPAPGHQVYPYLLRGVAGTHANHVHRYYVFCDAERVSVLGCGDGLVQPLRAQVGSYPTLDTAFCSTSNISG